MWRSPYLGLVLCLWLAPAATAFGQPAAEGEPRPLRIAAGDPQGAYSALASEIVQRLAASGTAAEVLSTAGSYDNAELLRDRRADLALMQSDVAYSQYFNGQPYRTLAGLYTEPIQIFVRRDLGLGDLPDLRRGDGPLRVAVGEPGSGTSFHALAVLAELGLPDDRLETIELSAGDAMEALVRRQAEVVFLTSAAPAPVLSTLRFRDLSLGDAVRLMDLDRRTARRLRQRFPFLHPVQVPLSAYPFLDHAVSSLGTRTLLVGRPDLPAATVGAVLDAVYAIAASAPPGLPGLDELAATEPEDVSIPFHPAAEAYHVARGDWSPESKRRLQQSLLAGLGLLILVVGGFSFSRIAYFFERFRAFSLAAVLVAVWLAGAEVMWLVEGERNVHFGSFGRSAEAILYYLFSGLESRYPVTPEGTVIALLVLSLGVGVVAAFTATIASRFVEVALNVRTLRAKPFTRLKLRDHLVITGWSQRTQRILRQLRSPDLKRPPTVVIITSDLTRTKVESRRAYKDTWVVEGDPSQQETLRRADVDTARAALVLSDNLLGEGTDGADDDASGDLLSLATTAAIETMQRRVHTVVDVERRRFEEHLGFSHADEVVVNEALAEGLISQCVINPGILSVYDELLSFGRGSQELYMAPLPAWLAGRPFREAQRLLAGCDLIPVGFCLDSGGAPALNPPPASLLPAQPDGAEEDGPRLVFMADQRSALPRRPPRQLDGLLAAANAAHGAFTPAAPGGASGGGQENGHRSFRAGICGSNHRLPWLTRELCRNPLWQDRLSELVLVGELSYVEQQQMERDDRIRTVFGDPSDPDVLTRAGIDRLHRLVVLSTVRRGQAEETAVRRADHETLLVCQAARTLAPHLHLVAEVLDPRHREIFLHLAPVEVVSVADLSEKLLAQAVINPGITYAFRELLTATATSSEIYLEPVPWQWVEHTFADAYRQAVADDGRQILLGYRTGSGAARRTVLNPPPPRRRSGSDGVDRDHVLVADDQLVVLSDLPPSWS